MGRAQQGPVAQRALKLGAGLFLLACTEFEAGTDELSASTEPLDQLPPTSGDWSCLGTVPSRAEPLLGDAITYTVQMIDLGTRAPITDATVTVCGLTDVECATPIVENLRVDADGWIDIPLTENFSGYLEVRSPMTVPAAFYLGDGLRTMTDYPFVSVTIPTFEGLTAAVGVVGNPATGTISVRTFDCQSETAPGAALINNTGGVPFYFTDGLPDITRRETDADGLGGFVNVPPGVTLLQSLLADGTVVDRRSFIIRPGWLTTAFMRPAGFQPPRLPSR